MGLTFASGHVLALRRFPASSVGPAYTSVWHREPTGKWTFFADVPPAQACTRYFGSAVAAAIQTPIHLAWLGPRELVVRMEHPDFAWRLRASSTHTTRLLNGISAALPESTWRHATALRLIGRAAGMLLQLGRVGLTGSVPNGQRFIATPRLLWVVQDSRAVLDGVDFGVPGPVTPQARLGDFWIPQRGVLAIGEAYFDAFDAAVHSAHTQKHQPVTVTD
jgi:hypothetical protein